MKLLLYGNSGSGKSTVGTILENMGYSKIVTTTTRNPRKGEVPGVDYHFVSKKEFSELSLLEFDIYAENLYGISKDNIDRSEKDSYIILTPSGIKSVAEYLKERREEYRVVYVFVEREEQRKRLLERGEEDESTQERLKLDFSEDVYSIGYDYALKSDENMEEKLMEFLEKN